MKHYKIRLLLTVALIASFSVNAQQKTPKFFAEVAAGPSFPIGQFGEKEYPGIDAKDQPGMAKTGMAANITLGYYIKENVGLLLTGGYAAYKQIPEGLEEYIKRNFYVSATDVDVNADDWKLLKVMVGGFYITPLTENKLNLVTKISAGILKTAVPAFSWRAYNATGPAFAGGENEEEKLPTSFCYQISLGLQYKLNERFHLLFDLNSFNATATDKAPPQPIGNPPGVPAEPDKKYRFGSVNALIGVGVSF
ncbi:hypothetical protein [Niastella sp. OAS944]|uniref:hypothetical protein n=1 Tax=Niastella sp. OAS944 TaxID=2664089 RepID=UPI003478A203|nr:hypothetical protein [Chitinophagaceae bacterium OAS944]